MTEQLKALAEAASGWEWLCDDPGCGCREAMEAFQKEATPERILALIAENERADKLLQQALEYAKLMKLYGPALGYGNTTIDDHIAAIRTYLENKNA